MIAAATILVVWTVLSSILILVSEGQFLSAIFSHGNNLKQKTFWLFLLGPIGWLTLLGWLIFNTLFYIHDKLGDKK